MKKIAGISLFITLFILNGCGGSPSRIQNQFMNNQLSGNYRTAYNGEGFRIRSYDGIRRYNEDNVAIIVTDAHGKSRTLYTRYTKSKPIQ